MYEQNYEHDSNKNCNYKSYDIGDTIAVKRGERAVSCKVIEKGVGETRNGDIILFKDKHVLWRLGHNNKWPNFVYRAFRGE